MQRDRRTRPNAPARTVSFALKLHIEAQPFQVGRRDSRVRWIRVAWLGVVRSVRGRIRRSLSGASRRRLPARRAKDSDKHRCNSATHRAKRSRAQE